MSDPHFYTKYGVNDVNEEIVPIKKEIVLPCSTRGIGFGVVSTLVSLQEFFPSILPQEVPVFQLYRVSLALLEHKMFTIFRESRVYEDLYYRNYEISDLRVLQYGIWQMPKMISVIVDSLGSFTRNNIKFVPVMARNRFDNGLLLPDAGSVYYRDLRAIVCSLSNDRTPLVVRKRFVNENSIPGAKFSADYILENPDDIMPAEGDNDSQLIRDVKNVKEFFGKYANRIKWLGLPPDLDSAAGMPFCAVATERSVFIPSAPDFATLQSKGLQNVKSTTVYSPIKLKSYEWLLGAANFLREPPGHLDDRYPFWNGCSVSVVPHSSHVYPYACIYQSYKMKISY